MEKLGQLWNKAWQIIQPQQQRKEKEKGVVEVYLPLLFFECYSMIKFLSLNLSVEIIAILMIESLHLHKSLKNFYFSFSMQYQDLLKQILILTIHIFKLEYKEINIVHLYMYVINNVFLIHATDKIPYRRVRQCQHTRMRVITMQ